MTGGTQSNQSRLTTLQPTTLRPAMLPVAWLVAVIILVGAGVGYRLLARHVKSIAGTPAYLPIALNCFPKTINGWLGQDIDIRQSVLEVAGNDDYLNRRYRRAKQKQWADVYVAYSARPRTMVGHRPRKCYKGAGWTHDQTRQTELALASGRMIPCLIHRFHLDGAEYRERVVLNYYVLNGRVTIDEGSFSGLFKRNPNVGGDIAHYVAQVQITSRVESSARAAACDLAETILEFLPDENGIVRAEGYSSIAGGRSDGPRN